MSDWIDKTLVDHDSHLVIDGIQEDGTLERATYTYCQGVVLGLETELAVRTAERGTPSGCIAWSARSGI